MLRRRFALLKKGSFQRQMQGAAHGSLPLHLHKVCARRLQRS